MKERSALDPKSFCSFLSWCCPVSLRSRRDESGAKSTSYRYLMDHMALVAVARREACTNREGTRNGL